MSGWLPASSDKIPKHARKELDAYLDRGLLCRGFARLRCASCPESLTVAFSCKGRGFCPSCMGRRMCATAAHLTDDVLPEVALRTTARCCRRWRVCSSTR